MTRHFNTAAAGQSGRLPPGENYSLDRRRLQKPNAYAGKLREATCEHPMQAILWSAVVTLRGKGLAVVIHAILQLAR